MRLLLDFHLIIRVSDGQRLPTEARKLIEDSGNEPCFSVVSLWELTNKRGRRPSGVVADAVSLRRDLLDNGYAELPILASDVLAVGVLPPCQGDLFGRLLLTADKTLSRYPSPVRQV